MADADRPAVAYVSPDGKNEMPVRSPATRINLEARGWTRKDGKTPASTTPTEQTKRTPARRPAADE